MSYLTQINLTTIDGTYRIIWIREQLGQNPGIRYGTYGITLGSHASYYADGHRHNETAGKVFQDSSFQGIPFSEITKQVQLSYQRLSLSASMLSLLGTKNTNEDIGTPNKLLTLHSDDYAEGLSLSYHLVKVGSEMTILRDVIPAFVEPVGAGDTIVGVEFIKLKCFPGLKVAVIILSNEDRHRIET